MPLSPTPLMLSSSRNFRLALLLLVFTFVAFDVTQAVQPQVLFGTTGNNTSSKLYIIDPATGFATSVATLHDLSANPFAVTGLAYDSANGVLYGATSTNSATSPTSLVSIDRISG